MTGLVEHLGTDPVATAPGSDFERRTAKELGNAEIWMLTQCKCNADLRDSETDRYCINVDLAEFKFQVFLATALRR